MKNEPDHPETIPTGTGVEATGESALKKDSHLIEQAEQFRVFKETTQDGFMLLDDKGRIIDVNKAYSRMSGYSQNELEQMSINDLEAKESTSETTEHIETIIKTGNDIFQSRHKRKNREIIDVEVSVTFWPAKSQFFSFIRDITARIKEEKELEKLRKGLEDMVDQRTEELGFALQSAQNANRVKTQFLSKMSHEFRTPLNAIFGFSQLLETDDSDEGNENTTAERKEHIKEILKAARHLLSLVDRILDFSSINNNLLDLHIKPLNSTPLIMECIKEMKPAAAERNISLETALEDRCMVLADKERLRKVLLSLLSNAVQYNRENGRVLVECSPDGNCGRISVEDTGIGIAEEYQQSIFEPFQNLGKEYSTFSGVGIGLAMAKQLVEEMGGYIGVTSRLGAGSTFWIELPFGNVSTCL